MNRYAGTVRFIYNISQWTKAGSFGYTVDIVRKDDINEGCLMQRYVTSFNLVQRRRMHLHQRSI